MLKILTIAFYLENRASLGTAFVRSKYQRGGFTWSRNDYGSLVITALAKQKTSTGRLPLGKGSIRYK